LVGARRIMSKQPPPTPQEIERGDQPRLSIASLVGRWYWCYPPLSCGYINIQSAEGDTPFERHDPPYACGKWVRELPNDDRYDYGECHCAVCNSLLLIPIPMGSSVNSMHARYYRSGSRNPNIFLHPQVPAMYHTFESDSTAAGGVALWARYGLCCPRFNLQRLPEEALATMSTPHSTTEALRHVTWWAGGCRSVKQSGCFDLPCCPCACGCCPSDAFWRRAGFLDVM